MRIFLSILLTGLLFVSCSKEEAAPEYTVHGGITITDAEYWPTAQEVRFGAFAADVSVPEYSEVLTNGNQLALSLSNLKEGSYQFKVYIAENGIPKYDLADFGTKQVSADLELNIKNVTLNTYQRVQGQLFNRCVQCHGNSAENAANLDLREGNSFAMLVDQASVHSAKPRVSPFEPDGSFIIQVLEKDNLNFEHTASTLATPGDIETVRNWIIKGALND